MTRVNLKQNVPTHLAFSIMLILSFLVAWFSIYSSRKILDSAKEMDAFNPKQRMEKNQSSI